MRSFPYKCYSPHYFLGWGAVISIIDQYINMEHGKRKRGRPKETQRRSVEREIKEKGWSWGEVVKLVKDKQQSRSLVTALCVRTHTKRIK